VSLREPTGSNGIAIAPELTATASAAADQPAHQFLLPLRTADAKRRRGWMPTAR
jgi:hypothetical protein